MPPYAWPSSSVHDRICVLFCQENMTSSTLLMPPVRQQDATVNRTGSILGRNPMGSASQWTKALRNRCGRGCRRKSPMRPINARMINSSRGRSSGEHYEEAVPSQLMLVLGENQAPCSSAAAAGSVRLEKPICPVVCCHAWFGLTCNNAVVARNRQRSCLST